MTGHLDHFNPANMCFYRETKMSNTTIKNSPSKDILSNISQNNMTQKNVTQKNAHGENQFKPNTTVAAIVHCQGKFLFVEEFENELLVLNQPAGHLEEKENLITAIKRELMEETGLSLEPNYLSGIYYFHRPELSLYFLRFCFVFEVEECFEAIPQDDEILQTYWLTLKELEEQIKDQPKRLRSPMVLNCIHDYLAGNKISLDHITSNIE